MKENGFLILSLAALAFCPAASMGEVPSTRETQSATGKQFAYLFFGSADTGEVWRGRADGLLLERLTEDITYRSVVLDLATGKIYRAVDSVDPRIERSDLDGSNREILVRTPGIPDELEIDPAASRMYWVERTTNAVKRANLDGSSVETVVSGLGILSGLAIDPANDFLFVFFDATRSIYRSALDGSSGATIFSQVGSGLYDLEVDTTNGFLYFSDTGRGLRRSGLDGSSPTHLFGIDIRELEIRGSSVYMFEGLGGPLIRSDLDGMNGTVVVDAGALWSRADFDIDPGAGHAYSQLGPSLLTRGFLGRIDLVPGTPNPRTIESTVAGNTHDVAVDPLSETLYIQGGSLLSMSFSGANLEAIAEYPGNANRGVDLDTTTGRLFLTDDSGQIEAIDVDGTDFSTLATRLSNPHDVALDSAAGFVYFTAGIDSGSGSSGAVRRVALAGGVPEDMLTGLDPRIRGLAFDGMTRELFWTDQGAGTISKLAVDGPIVAMPIVSGLDRPHDVAIDETTGRLYWTEGIRSNDLNTGAVRSANPDGSDVQTVFSGLSSLIRDIAFAYWADGSIFVDGFESGGLSAWSASVPRAERRQDLRRTHETRYGS